MTGKIKSEKPRLWAKPCFIPRQ